MSSLIISIGILSIPIYYDVFDPFPWLTLIISGTFGLTITLIVNTRSQKILDYLNSSERERQVTAIRTIKNNAKEIEQSVDYYAETIKNKTITTEQKRELLKTFFPKFKTLIALSHNLTPSLGNLIQDVKLNKIENYLKLLNDLLLILEFGNNETFENNIPNLKDYSMNLNKVLCELSY